MAVEWTSYAIQQYVVNSITMELTCLTFFSIGHGISFYSRPNIAKMYNMLE